MYIVDVNLNSYPTTTTKFHVGLPCTRKSGWEASMEWVSFTKGPTMLKTDSFDEASTVLEGKKEQLVSRSLPYLQRPPPKYLSKNG